MEWRRLPEPSPAWDDLIAPARARHLAPKEPTVMPNYHRVFTEARKFGVAVLGLAATVAASDAVPERYRGWAQVVLALATALGVYHVENVPSGTAASTDDPPA